jgi:hypothetical protein
MKALEGPDPERKECREGGPGRFPERDYETILKSTGIAHYEVSRGDDGMWIQLWKKSAATKGDSK